MTRASFLQPAVATLKVQDLSYAYQGLRVINRVNLEVNAGEITAITGPSGSGKTTLLLLIAGLLAPDSGAVFIDGVNVTNLATNERRCTLVFQDALLFPNMNVTQNVAYGPKRQGLSRSESLVVARELLDWVGASELAERRIDTLSGGQAQRVALARALAARPKVLLLDEPFSALDAPVRAEMASQLRDLVKRAEVAAVHVTHDLDEAQAIADRVVALYELFGPR
jgi:spermidine/putrescine transport system ATP-binding protein